MPATNKHLHDRSIYYKDGIFCEPPRKVVDATPSAEAERARSYHWEERDLLPFAQKEFEASLVGKTLWRKNADELTIETATLSGDCASSLRKHKRILTYALVASAVVRGSRGDAGVRATLTSPEFCHDDDSLEDVEVAVERLPYAGDDAERAMKTYELFSTLVRRKAKPLLLDAIRDLKAKLQCRGGGDIAPAAVAGAPEEEEEDPAATAPERDDDDEED